MIESETPAHPEEASYLRDRVRALERELKFVTKQCEAAQRLIDHLNLKLDGTHGERCQSCGATVPGVADEREACAREVEIGLPTLRRIGAPRELIAALGDAAARIQARRPV